MTPDPFATLGLGRSASASDVRAARRELAREHHPDVGGDASSMQRINAAAAAALKAIADPPTETQPGVETDWVGTTRDIPSFTVEALPAETFEALLLATKQLGEIEDEDPPYELRTLMWSPLDCWCQLNIVPDAGASTVSLSIAAADGQRLPSLVEVRNAWIAALNELDWSTL